MKKKLLFVSCFLLILIPYSISAKEYSLTELWRLALEKSEIIKMAEEDLYISERQKDKAKSVIFPKFSAFGSHRRYSKEKRKDLLTIQPEYNTSWGIRVDQSLSISGREFTAFKIAGENIIKTRHDLDSVKRDYLLKVSSEYYNVLKAKKAIEIAKANVERLKKHRDAARIRLEVGEVTKTVLLRAETELAGGQSDMIRAENNLMLAKTVLAGAVGISGDYDITESKVISRESEVNGCKVWASDTQHVTLDSQAIDCLKAKAVLERSELKALNIEKEITIKKVIYAKGSYWPTLYVEGVYSRQENYPSTSSEIRETIYAGIKFDFPFFEGGLRRAEVREAKAKLRQVELVLLDLQNSIDIEVENSYLNVITESSILTKLRTRVAYATDNYNMVSKQFEYGLANIIDVIDANTLMVTAERELADARFNYESAILKLKRATGTFLKTGDVVPKIEGK